MIVDIVTDIWDDGRYGLRLWDKSRRSSSIARGLGKRIVTGLKTSTSPDADGGRTSGIIDEAFLFFFLLIKLFLHETCKQTL